MVADGEEAELVLYHVAAVHPKRSVIASRQRVEGAGERTGVCIFQLLYSPEAPSFCSVSV